MATQPVQRDPIRVAKGSYGTTRIQMSPKGDTLIQFFNPRKLEEDFEEVTLTGCSELVVQGRMCGDAYAELSGPRFCVSAVAPEMPDAVRAALAKARGE